MSSMHFGYTVKARQLSIHTYPAPPCPFPKFWGTSSAPFVNNNQNSGRVPRPNKSQNFGGPGTGAVEGSAVVRPLARVRRPRDEGAASGSPNGSLIFSVRCGISQVDNLSDIMQQWERCEGCALFGGGFFAFFYIVDSRCVGGFSGVSGREERRWVEIFRVLMCFMFSIGWYIKVTAMVSCYDEVYHLKSTLPT